MDERMSATRAAAVALLAMLLGACDGLFGPPINCGPLEPSACDQAVEEIRAVVIREYPARRIVFIEFVNEDGHANVRLDDGTEIGWGERP
jgi:hypothetical protein